MIADVTFNAVRELLFETSQGLENERRIQDI